MLLSPPEGPSSAPRHASNDSSPFFETASELARTHPLTSNLALDASRSVLEWSCRRCHFVVMGTRPLGCVRCGRPNAFAPLEARTATHKSASNITAFQWADATEPERLDRMLTGLPGFDRVMGGGVVGRQLVFVGGTRGGGKSTLLLHVLAGLVASTGRRVVVAPLEQGTATVRRMFDEQGLRTRDIAFSNAREASEIFALARELRAAAVLIDSWKLLRVDGREARSNTNAERAAVMLALALAKEQGIAVFGVLHMRTGSTTAYAAGAACLQLCDTVLRLDRAKGGARVLSCDGKNRYGDDGETATYLRKGTKVIEAEASE